MARFSSQRGQRMTGEKNGTGISEPASHTAGGGASSPPARNDDGLVLEWEAMSAGRKTVCIRYRGMDYQLRETRNGKLILTK